MLWAAFFCSLMTLHFYGSWLPTLLRGIGLSQPQAIASTVAGQVGNLLFSVVLARLIIKIPVHKVIAFTFIVGGLMMVVVSVVGARFAGQIAANALAVGLLAGSLGGLYAFAPTVYGPAIRVTGAGWAIGMGRFGSILGPAIAGMLLSRQWTPMEVFQLAAVPAVASGVLCLLIGLLTSESRGSVPQGSAAY
jgi:hypothetical protein